MKPLHLLRPLLGLLTCCIALLVQAQMTNLLSPALKLGYQETALNYEAQNDVKTSDGTLAPPATEASAERTSAPAITTIRYVKVGGSGNGSTWATASGDLQAMINASAANDQVWVAAGTYKPNAYPTGCEGCGSSRDYTFFVKDGVKLYGGFLGDETSLSQRNFSTNVTTLSGDVGAVGDNTDNVYHVVLSFGNIGVTIDGFSIRGGYADSETTFKVGAYDGVPRNYGGGIHILYSPSTITNNIIDNNFAHNGGGIYLETVNGTCTITNNIIINNSSQLGGGGCYISYSEPTFANNLCYNNSASYGGAVFFDPGPDPRGTFINNTFCRNSTEQAEQGAVFSFINSSGRIINNIFWDNAGSDISPQGYVTPTYSLQNQDPLFVNPLDPDGPDNIFRTADDGFRLKSGSPALNSGTATDAPTTDILGAARPQGDGVDMGAYEGIGGSCTTPTAYTVTGTGSYCTGAAGLAVGLANSETGVTYQLKNGTTDVGTAMDGTGAALSFGNQTAGTYTVVATRTSGGCTATMTGSAVVSATPAVTPTINIAADPSGAITSGTNVTFTATISNGGTTPGYQWYKNNNAVGSNAASYSDNALANGDVIKCTLTSNATCASPTAVTSGAITMSVSAPPASNIRYVKPVASGTGNGSSWANASADIQAMINASSSGGEVWVAAGTYKPNAYPTGCEGCGSSRDYTFFVKDGVKLYGGFFGDETSLSQRNFSTNVTTLSGDVGAVGDNTDNVYHVVLSAGNIGVTIDGFSITGGNANPDGNNIITVNGLQLLSTTNGGGINLLGNDSSIYTIANNTISGNLASGEGGGISIYFSSLCSITNNILFDNSAEARGGGIYIQEGSLVLSNNLLYNNNANESGGAIEYAQLTSGSNTSMVINNTFFSNHVNISFGGAIRLNGTTPVTLKNNIFWENTAFDNVGGLDVFGEGVVTYCLTQQNSSFSTGTGIINNQNPLFVNPSDPDGPDNVFFTADDGFRLKSGSPALNTGTATDAPTTDILGAARPQGTGIDMGAYEGAVGSSCTTPTAYTVTGGGTYCLGATGKAVGLNNSQTGVNYQLKKATVSVGDPIAGTTGTAINFGIQPEGTYTVVATDAATGACSINMTGSALVTLNSTPPSVSPLPASICLGATLNLSASAGSSTSQSTFNSPSISLGADANTYSWASSGGTFSSSTQYATFSSSNSGSFSFSVTVTSNGCTATATASTSVNSSPAPQVSIQLSSTTICINQGLTLTALNPTTNTSPDTYSWASSGGDFRSNLQTARFSHNAAGGYSFTVTADNGVCTATATASVSVRSPSAGITAAAGASVCAGASIELSASGGEPYSWSASGGSFSSATGSPVTWSSPATGGFSVSVTSGEGNCSATATATLSVKALPETGIRRVKNVYCVGENVNMDLNYPDTQGYTYSWKGSDGSFRSDLSRVSFSSSLEGAFSFTVSVTSSNGCTATGTTSVSITKASASIEKSVQSLCTGQTLNLTASGGSTYSWDKSGGNFNSSVQNASFSSSSSGGFSFTVTVTNSNNCTATATASVSVNASPIASISQSKNAVCPGQSISLEAREGTSYSWSSSGGTFSSSLNKASFSSSSAGSFSFSVTVSDVNNCTATTTATATVNPGPNLSINKSASAVCSGGTISLTASGGSAYSWMYVGEGSFSSNANTASFNANTAGPYSITVAASLGSCTASISTGVTVNGKPVVSISPTAPTICAGQTLNLTATASMSRYSWDKSGGTFSSTTNQATFSSPTAGSFRYSVSVQAKATASISPSTAQTVCLGSSLKLTASGGSSYTWTGPNAFTGSTAVATVNSSSGAYTGVYQAQITTGVCTASASVSVSISAVSAIAKSNGTGVCAGGEIKLTATGGQRYSWSGPASFSSTQQNPVRSLASESFNGIYTVTVTGDFSCSNTATVSAAIFTAKVGSNSPVCTGGAIQFNASGGSSYSWYRPTNNFSSTQQNPILPNAKVADGGVYFLRVTGGNACIIQTMVAVTVTGTTIDPTFASISSTICNGSSVTLKANASSASYSWSGPNNFTSNNREHTFASFSTANQGLYKLWVKTAQCLGYSEKEVRINCGARVGSEEGTEEQLVVKVWENPTRGRLQVEVRLAEVGGVELEWIDSRGRVMEGWKRSEEARRHELELDVAKYEEGMYLLRVQSGQHHKTLKVWRIE